MHYYIGMIYLDKKIKWVGEFIRRRREALKMSQRALGLMFDPPVTTQFISNVERGVTPLPPSHIPILAKALTISPSEITDLLEKEYAAKLNGRLGQPNSDAPDEQSKTPPNLVIAQGDYEFMKNLYDAYRLSDQKTKQTFTTVCESILMLPKTGS